jgi:hypothetical protein
MEEFNKLFNTDELNEILEDNRDPYRKEIGDRVNVLDFSSVTHMNGRELDYEDDDEMQFGFLTYFIVIETGQRYTHDAYYKKYRQDVVIVNPLTNKKYRVNSGHLQLR